MYFRKGIVKVLLYSIEVEMNSRFGNSFQNVSLSLDEFSNEGPRTAELKDTIVVPATQLREFDARSRRISIRWLIYGSLNRNSFDPPVKS